MASLLTGGFVPLSRTSFRWIIGGSAHRFGGNDLMWIFVDRMHICDLIWIYLISNKDTMIESCVYIYVIIHDCIWLYMSIYVHTLLELFWWDCGKLLSSNFESFVVAAFFGEKHNLRSGKRRPRTRDGHFVGWLSWTNALGAFFDDAQSPVRWSYEICLIRFKPIYESNKRTVGRHPEFARTDGLKQTCRSWSRCPICSTAEGIFQIQNISKRLELHATIVWCHSHPIVSSSSRKEMNQ